MVQYVIHLAQKISKANHTEAEWDFARAYAENPDDTFAIRTCLPARLLMAFP